MADPWAVVSQKPAPASPYETEAQFRARMDKAFGPGKWRETSGYRDPARNRRVGGVPQSAHMRGTRDAPGAHDIVVPGMDEAAAARRLPKDYRALAEGRVGNQGPHLHIEDADPWAVASSAPAPAADPWKPVNETPAPAKASTTPRKPASGFPGADIAGRVVEAVGDWWNRPSTLPASGGLLPNVGRSTARRFHGSRQALDTGLAGMVWEKPPGSLGELADEAALKAGAGLEAIGGATGMATAPAGGAVEAATKKPTLGDIAEALVPLPGLKGLGRARAGKLSAETEAAVARAQAAGATVTVGGRRVPLTPRSRIASAGPSIRPRAAAQEGARASSLTKPSTTPPKPPQGSGGPPSGSGGAIPPHTAAQAVKSGASSVQKLFAPATLGEGRPTAAVIRRSRGQHQLMADKAIYDMAAHARRVGNLPVAQQRALVDAIETGKTAQIADVGLRKAADTIKAVYKTYRDRIGYVLGDDGPTFIKDYYTHMWKERPADVEDSMRRFYARQGTGANLKKRTIPTIADGIKAGLTPVTENPIEATGVYVQNMSRYLTTHDVQNQLHDMGLTKWATPGAQPKGWVALDGIKTQKVRPTDPPRQIQLYAPEHAARVYNNWISRGFEAGDVAPLFEGARKLANGVTMLKLGLSGYHAFNMANEALVSEGARALQAASRGQMLTAAKGAARWATIAGPAVKAFNRGRQLERELLGVQAPDMLSRKVNDAFINSGGQLRMDKLYNTTGVGSFYKALKTGTFTRELGDALKATTKGTLPERGRAVAQLAARTLQSSSDPLFQDIIPNLKRGAFAQNMHDWIAANPNADQAAVDRYAIQLQDSIDNRFGELVQDNLFWKRQMKQTAQLLLLSPSWKIGTWREIGGGLVDIPKSVKGLMAGKGIEPRTAYDISLAASTAMVAGVATYLMTRTAPHGRDFIAPRTGGTDISSGEPERAALPGYQKEVYGQANILGQGPAGWGPGELAYLKSAMNPGLSATADIAGNKDWRGLPIYRPPGATPQEGEPTLADQLLEDTMPITFSQFAQRKQGTAISPVMSAMGFRASPQYIEAPDYAKQERDYFATKDWQKRIKADQSQKAKELQ